MWGSGDCPQKNFLEQNCLECQKVPLQTIGEMDRVQYDGKFLPSYSHPMDECRGGSCPSCPLQSRRPFSYFCADSSRLAEEVGFPFVRKKVRKFRIFYIIWDQWQLYEEPGGHGRPEIFLSPLLPLPIFLENCKILNFEYTIYCKYLRNRKVYKE